MLALVNKNYPEAEEIQYFSPVLKPNIELSETFWVALYSPFL